MFGVVGVAADNMNRYHIYVVRRLLHVIESVTEADTV